MANTNNLNSDTSYTPTFFDHLQGLRIINWNLRQGLKVTGIIMAILAVMVIVGVLAIHCTCGFQQAAQWINSTHLNVGEAMLYMGLPAAALVGGFILLGTYLWKKEPTDRIILPQEPFILPNNDEGGAI